MAFRKKIWYFENSREVEYTHKGRYGAPGEKRGPRRKRTPADIKRANQTNRVNRVRRKIKANFREDDYWSTLTYKKEERKPP